ncbi:MAG: ankyrin repeat domain-containing protein, partial [Akkermansia sp.]|nr:ankyrin repeat domain-containing protein [Akkermansia sp.]
MSSLWVEAAPGCAGADRTVSSESRMSANERLVEILKADSPEIPADIWVCTRAVCKRPFASKRKGESSFFEGRVENGALLRAAAQYNAVNTISWLLKERKADPHDMLWDNYGSPLSDEVSPLHVAAKYGSVEAARLLLAAGVNPNVVDKQGNTPLMLAVASGGENAYDMVSLLLAHGANPALRNNVGKAAVDLVPPRAQRVFGKLCWYGVKPQNEARYNAWVREESMSFSSDTPVLYFWYAVHADDLAQAEEWLKKGVNPQAYVMGVRPLWVAINHGNA